VEPIPIPLPPVSSLEAWVNTQLPVLVKSNNIASESRLVAECFEQIVERIDDGNIKTPQNAQAQLQIALTGTLALASPTAVTEWMPFMTELSRRIETELGEQIDNLAAVKAVLQKVANAVNSLEKSEPVLRTPLQNMDNPNNRGQGTPNRVFRNLLTR